MSSDGSENEIII